MELKINAALLALLGLAWGSLTARTPVAPLDPSAAHPGVQELARLEDRVAHEPDDPIGVRRLAEAYLDMHRPGLAVAVLRAADPAILERPTIAHRLAEAYERSGRVADALATADLALRRCARALGTRPSATPVPLHVCDARAHAVLSVHRDALAHLVAWGVDRPSQDPRTADAYARATRRARLAFATPCPRPAPPRMRALYPGASGHQGARVASAKQGLPHFLTSKLTGALLLMGAAVAAIAWANSPFAESYRELFSTTLGVFFGDFGLKKPLVLWINDGLMGVFFFYVGLEIKREVRIGELSSPRRVALPAFAALGGMVGPASIFAAITMGTPAIDGWGIPMATDIAFALGVLAILGDRVPASLKVFLTALAIVDDIGAVTVVALFYTDEVALLSLGTGAALLLVGVVLNRRQVRHTGLYFALGLLVWLAFLKSGVHATIAALLMAFTIPARSKIDGEAFASSLEGELRALRELGLPKRGEINSLEQQEAVDALGATVHEASSPLLQLEHALVPVVGLLVMPVFALANAGVSIGEGIGEAIQSPLAVGVLVGLLVGKPVGVVLMSFLAVRLRVADLPEGVSWRHITGAGFLSGIGFTMALFIASLAFDAPQDVDAAKVGILLASALAGVTGALLLRSAPAVPSAEPVAAGEMAATEAAA